MLEWKNVELSDKQAINELICASGCHGADYAFANLYMWRHAYNPQIAFVGRRLLVGMPHWGIYAYPKGDGDVRPSIEALLQEAHSNGNKLVIRGLTDRTLQEFLPIYGDRFEIEEDRDNADYIYTVDKLCNLTGRKLSSKRNHIKHFEKNGPWEFKRVTSDNLEPAREFVAKFYEVKDNPELENEATAIDEMFNNFDELGFLAGMLYQNGEAVAFTAGTKLDEEVFDTHFEKALPDVDGAYPMVNREFARLVHEVCPEIGAFNREEDMGIEGLRKAKLSYRPDILMMKYFAREK